MHWLSLAWTAEHDMALYLANRCFGDAWHSFSKLFPVWKESFLVNR